MKLVERLKNNHLAVAVSLVVAVSGTTWTVFNELLHKPDRLVIEERDRKIEDLRRQIEDLRQQSSQRKDLQPSSTESDRSQVKQQKNKSEEATGKIFRPVQDSQVKFPFRYEVEINHPHNGLYYYLSIEVEGRQWPEARILTLPHGGRIEGEIAYRRSAFSSPGGYTIFLMLFEVDESEHKKIEQWLQGPDAGGLNVNGRLMSRRTISAYFRSF
ncbi:MAG TPA: hypothetical protein VMW06_04865 [Desulfobacterales bacterium]|nr:hypothetical protein [Desulfobacterales bacterium]